MNLNPYHWIVGENRERDRDGEPGSRAWGVADGIPGRKEAMPEAAFCAPKSP
jgi:hypothetical protein